MIDLPPTDRPEPDAFGSSLTQRIERILALEQDAIRLRQTDPSAALESARDAAALAEVTPDAAVKASTAFQLGSCLLALHDFDAASEQLEIAARRAWAMGDEDLALRSELGRTHVHVLRGEIDRAAARLLDLEEPARRAADPRFLCAVLNNLGNVFDSLRQPQRAVEYVTRALEHARRTGERRSLGLALSNLGGLLANLGEPERARRSLEEAIDVYWSIGEEDGVAQATGNLALIFEQQGLIDEAIERHRSVLAYFEAVNDIENVLVSLTQTAALEQRRGNLDEALGLLRRALSETTRRGLQDGIEQIHAQLSSVYEALGDAARALLHYRQAAELRHRTEQSVNRLALFELQRRVDRNEQLSDEVVDELVAMRERAIETMNGNGNGHDAEPRLSIEQQAEIVAELRSRLERLETPLSDPARRSLDGLLEELASPGRRTRDLQRQVDSEGRPFLQRLSARYPMLTPAELRVCSLLRANLSTKEMAQLLSVTERNIESHRYSIRRKLALDKQQQLATWLAAF